MCLFIRSLFVTDVTEYDKEPLRGRTKLNISTAGHKRVMP